MSQKPPYLSPKQKIFLKRMDKSLRRTIKFGGKTGKQARVDGCDNTLRLSQGWMKRNRGNWDYWLEVFKSTGGYCDCEVLLNSFYELGIRK